jgi:ferredoxin
MMAAKLPTIDAARCSGCGRCIAACQPGLIAFERRGWRKISVLQDEERCTGCSKCDAMCPIGAITMGEKVALSSHLGKAQIYISRCSPALSPPSVT